MPETPNELNVGSTAKFQSTAPASILEYSAQSGVSGYAIDGPQYRSATMVAGLSRKVVNNRENLGQRS